MATSGVVIRRGLPDEMRAGAAALFEQAFGSKLAVALPSSARRQALIECTLVAERVVVAMDGDALLGLVGLSAADGRYVGGSLDFDQLGLGGLQEALGTIGTLRAALILGFLEHEPEPGELYIDEIAVAAEARGRGIGTQLLDEVATIAREDGFSRLRLDVVDTNPRARALYEREGFRVVRAQKLWFMSRILGFGVVQTMELAVEGA